MTARVVDEKRTTDAPAEELLVLDVAGDKEERDAMLVDTNQAGEGGWNICMQPCRPAGCTDVD